jgi:hypothetical protein
MKPFSQLKHAISGDWTYDLQFTSEAINLCTMDAVLFQTVQKITLIAENVILSFLLPMLLFVLFENRLSIKDKISPYCSEIYCAWSWARTFA